MPYRSEELVVQEKIRRAEEDVTELLDRQKVLRAELAARGRQRVAWLLLFGGVIAAGVIGWGAGSMSARTREAQARASIDSDDQIELLREHSQVIECQAAADRTSSDLQACQRSLADKARAVAANEAAEGARCACQESDPNCYCPFDRGAAAAALAAAQSPVRLCFVPAKAETFHTRVTFEPRTGRLEHAVIDTSDGNLSEADRACVIAVLQKVAVPPFSGSSIMVGKTFYVRAP